MSIYKIPFFLLLTSAFAFAPFKPPPTSSTLEEQLVTAFAEQQWDQVLKNSREILFYHCPEAHQHTLFEVGVSYFHLGEYDMANRFLEDYVHFIEQPEYFEEAVYYRLLIAEKFRLGEKKRATTERSLKILSAKEDALEIYDEIIQTFPGHEYAVKSLFGKGAILQEFGRLDEALQAFHSLIAKFPLHELAIESFIEIERTYLLQAQYPSISSEVLDLAEVNLENFRKAFQGEERIKVAESLFLDTQEIFAKSLLNTGIFYERTKKVEAAKMYYYKVFSQFPDTLAAVEARERFDFFS